MRRYRNEGNVKESKAKLGNKEECNTGFTGHMEYLEFIFLITWKNHGIWKIYQRSWNNFWKWFRYELIPLTICIDLFGLYHLSVLTYYLCFSSTNWYISTHGSVFENIFHFYHVIVEFFASKQRWKTPTASRKISWEIMGKSWNLSLELAFEACNINEGELKWR